MRQQQQEGLPVEWHHLRNAVTELWIAIGKDRDGDEIVLTYQGPEGELVPLIAQDTASLSVLRSRCLAAQKAGQSVSIISFTRNSVYETFPAIATGD